MPKRGTESDRYLAVSLRISTPGPRPGPETPPGSAGPIAGGLMPSPGMPRAVRRARRSEQDRADVARGCPGWRMRSSVGQALSRILHYVLVQSSVPNPVHFPDPSTHRSRYGIGVGSGTPGAAVGQRVRRRHGRPAQASRQDERCAPRQRWGWRGTGRCPSSIASIALSAGLTESPLQDCALTRRWSSYTVLPGRPNAGCAQRMSLPLRGQTNARLPDWHGYLPLH